MIITIDGPAGTGKSTVARELARQLEFVFFDTGAMYRAVTYKLVKDNIPFTDKEQVEASLEDFPFRIETLAHDKRYYVGEEEVTDQIRAHHVTRHVSEVSALPEVRRALVELQRRFAAETDAVFEGRDMGTDVFPNADVKVFLTATPEVRAERRFREYVFKHPSEAENLSKQQVLEDILRRDAYDSAREHSPLRPADDAHIIDTSDLTIEEVVEKILALMPNRDQTHTAGS